VARKRRKKQTIINILALVVGIFLFLGWGNPEIRRQTWVAIAGLIGFITLLACPIIASIIGHLLIKKYWIAILGSLLIASALYVLANLTYYYLIYCYFSTPSRPFTAYLGWLPILRYTIAGDVWSLAIPASMLIGQLFRRQREKKSVSEENTA